MKFRNFAFPTFDEWYNNKCCCGIKLGCFYAEIATFSGFCTDGVFMGAISTYHNPINVYATQYAFVKGFAWKKSDGIDKLKDWYNNTTKSLNEQFKNYLINSLIEK